MKKITPKFVCDEDGKKTGVIFTKKEFEKMVEFLEDYDDYKMVKKRAGKIGKTYTAEEICKEFGLRR